MFIVKRWDKTQAEKAFKSTIVKNLCRSFAGNFPIIVNLEPHYVIQCLSLFKREDFGGNFPRIIYLRDTLCLHADMCHMSDVCAVLFVALSFIIAIHRPKKSSRCRFSHIPCMLKCKLCKLTFSLNTLDSLHTVVVDVLVGHKKCFNLKVWELMNDFTCHMNTPKQF